MISNIENLKIELNKRKGKLSLIQQQIKEKKFEKKKIQRSYKLNEKAQIVIQEVVRLTKEKLKYHLSDISSLAMASVFENPYNVIFDFLPRRGKIEADIWFEKNNSLFSPYSTGGGAVDIASLAIRFSCYTLQTPKTRPIMLLDEPLKFLKGKEMPMKGAELISEISKRLGIQVIMVSHNSTLIDCADRVIRIEMENGRSIVDE